MKVGFVSCGVIVGGVALLVAIGGSSQTAMADTTAAAAPDRTGDEVIIKVEADCKVDVEEAHISESKNEVAIWQLNGDPGPLVIQFKEDKGRNALEVSSIAPTKAKARIKLAKQQGRHPYRIKIGEKECPDPVLIIDG